MLHAWRVRSLTRLSAQVPNNRLLKDLLLAPDPFAICTKQSRLFAGVEHAAEIATDMPDKRVTLVHSGPSLLADKVPKLGAVALKWLQHHNVQASTDRQCIAQVPSLCCMCVLCTMCIWKKLWISYRRGCKNALFRHV